MDFLESSTDEELDELRRATLAEQERRKKLEDGKQLIGESVRAYADAAKLDCPDLEDDELGEYVVNLIVEDQDDA